MMTFLRILKKNILNVLPLHVGYVLICCIYEFVSVPDRYTLLILMLCGFFCEICAFFMSIGETIREGDKSPYRRIIKGCFKGFSKPAVLFKRAVAEMNELFFDDALEDFKEAEEYKMSEREEAVLAFYLGNCYNSMGYPTNAAMYLRKAIDKNISVDFVYILCARAYVANGSFDDAMEVYNALLKRACRFDYVYTDMGMCLLKAQKYDEAMSLFEKSAAEGMNYSFALGGCSLAALALKDVEKSKEFFSKALLNNLNDLDGFREYYCEVAEAVGVLELIDENMKKKPQDGESAEDKSDGEN